jgi:hypothetical protein
MLHGGYFNLPQNVHDLLWGMLLSLAHPSLLLFQFLSTKLVQNLPGTPKGMDPEDWGRLFYPEKRCLLRREEKDAQEADRDKQTSY